MSPDSPRGNDADTADDGTTPVDEDERDGLIPSHLLTKAELNQWEALGIAGAYEWLSRRRKSEVLTVEFLRELHRRMFEATWKWAGTFRLSDKNVSPHHWTNVAMLMRNLVDNTKARYDASEKAVVELDEIAVRFHHELVRIHPWPNGNGRHSRLATDLLLQQWGRPPFSWGGGADLARIGEARSAYIKALQQADGGDFDLLRQFVRS